MRKPSPKLSGFLKNPSAQSEPNYDELPPAFSFEKMQDCSGNSLNCCEDADRVSLVKRIFMLSREQWKNIRLAPASGLGAEQIPRYRIKPPIPNVVTEDVSSFTALHYQGKKRFIGYRVGQIFYILWVDHNFSVYDHGP